jgi:hypothetical protein
MRSAVDMIFNAFLSLQPAEKQERLLHFLPDDERGRIKNMAPFSRRINPEEFSNGALLEMVHWSWFLPTLKSYSPQEQYLFLAVLDASSARALASEIPCKLLKTDLAFLGRSYLRQLLLNSLVSRDAQLLPIDYLPSSPLNRLLKMTKTELIKLIDLLAMHDLAVEIRQIVETKILKKIYSFLSEGQRRFLKLTTARHEVMLQQKIGLDRWDGNEESLKHLLHKRGIARLGSALSGQDPSLAWYVCHRLDIGRGSALFKLCEEKKSGAAVDTAKRQVEELLEYEL